MDDPLKNNDEHDLGLVTKKLLEYARDLAESVQAKAIVFYADVFPDNFDAARVLADSGPARLVMLTRETGLEPPFPATVLKAPDIRLTRLGQIKVAMLLGLARGVFERGDYLVCLTGIAATGLLDTVVFMTVGGEFDLFSAAGGDEVARSLDPQVFERVIDIAVTLGVQGREGRPVGTIFVLGDTKNVRKHSEQMILNPFSGYPESRRNILDPRIEETVKEFATVDGAFLIRQDGVIEACGVFLRSPISGVELPGGMGARHKSAAAVSLVTKAVVVTVSKSTGNVSVFRDGKLVIEIEKPRPVAARKIANKNRERGQQETWD